MPCKRGREGGLRLLLLSLLCPSMVVILQFVRLILLIPTLAYIYSLVVGNVGSDTVQWIILEVCMTHDVMMVLIMVMDGLN